MKYLIFCSFVLRMFAQSSDEELWVKQQLSNMSLSQKVGQLFMVAAYGKRDAKQRTKLLDFVKNHHIGGVVFFQGNVKPQIELTETLQNASSIPLLIGIDGEWGLAMRLKNTFRYPWNMTLGAVQNDTLIERMGIQIAKHCKQLGIHINFAPVVDVNNNPANPIIGSRSFGENPETVSLKASALIRGMRSQNILVCAKHFPGHGDTQLDSHKRLPLIPYDRKHLEKVELYPYKQLFKAPLDAIMVGHLNVPLLTGNNKPSSLSYKVCTNLLQKQMGFKGLIITDGLNMKGVYYGQKKGASIPLQAFLAGNDILLLPKSLKHAFRSIKKAVKSRIVSKERLNHSVKKILIAKYRLGLFKKKTSPVSKKIPYNLNTYQDSVLKVKLMKSAITLIKNHHKCLPIRDLDKYRVAYIKMGEAPHHPFLKMLQRYHSVKVFEVQKEDRSILKTLEKERINKVIVGYHRSDDSPWKSFDFTVSQRHFIEDLSRKFSTILTLFASAYSLSDCHFINHTDAVLLAYQNSVISQNLAAQMIFGALTPKGKLPVRIGDCFPVGYGLHFDSLSRLSYLPASMAGMSAQKLSKIDTVLSHIVRCKMAPGGQVLIARHGRVVYHKSFGYQTYAHKEPILETDWYDLASLTKLLGALPLLMEAYEQDKIKLTNTFAQLFPYFQSSNKDSLCLKELLSHKSGMRSWIPFYKKTLDSITQKPLSKYYRSTSQRGYTIPVAKNMYLKNTMIDTIYQSILKSPLDTVQGYRYSDLFYILLPRFFKRVYHKTVNELLREDYFKPMGAEVGYCSDLMTCSVIPSEEDDYFRYQRVKGFVHDMTAAMLGGVSTHAGLFGNAHGVAKMMQLFLQEGFYGGHRYFNAKTFNLFNQSYYADQGVRRGLVMDKPSITGEEKNTCNCVSSQSFGHSGFTGTYTWADPQTGLLYVFLSNRTFPSSQNNNLFKYNIRTLIQHMAVDAIVD